MSDSITLTGNSRPWGGQATGDCGPYTDGQWRTMFKTLFDGSGNRGPLLNWGGEFQVTQRGAGANMSVDVADGAAIIDGLWAYSASTVNLTVAANTSGMTRYDLVFLHWTAAAQVANVRIVDGTPGAGSCESVSNYQNAGVEWAVPLACIEVANGAASILNANITDLREFCRYRMEGNDIVDGVTLDTNATTHLIQIADGGVGVDQVNVAVAGAGLAGGGGAALSVDGATVAGDGLTSPGGAVVDVNPDGVTLETNADAVRIAAGAAGDGLTGGGGVPLAVNVDNATIKIVADILQVWSINNSNIANRTRSCYLGANALHATVANAPTWGAIGAQPVPTEGWVCATGVDDYVVGHWRVPADFVAGAVTVTIIWSHVASADTVCRLRLDYINAMGCGGSLVGGTTSITQDTNALLADANKRMCTQLSTTITMAANEYLDFFVGRNGAHVNDTLATDIVLHDVIFSYTADM